MVEEEGGGNKGPDFALRDTKGFSRSMSDIMGKNGLLLIFYRGSFCPYCVGQLASMSRYTAQLRKLGVNTIAVSVDSVAENDALSRQLRFSFPILSDSKLTAIKSYGVAEEKVGASYPEGISKPAVFLLDRKGNILYRYISRDFLDRPPTEELVNVVKTAIAKMNS